MNPIKIVIAGPRGKMGREAVKLVEVTNHFQLVAVIDKINDGLKLSSIEGFQQKDVPIYKDPEKCFQLETPDVLIDLTTPDVGKKHTKLALQYGVRPVVGTTGFTEDELKAVQTLSEQKGLGAVIAPNFAIGAILMMKFSQMAAKYLTDVEIIEMHHDQKLDAPSGTGLKTAEMISVNRPEKRQGHPDEKETLDGARGAVYQGIPIHSVRLPGLVGHQQVMFGGDGQALTIRHDSFNRASFMSGVKLSVETVMQDNNFIYGLENIIE
ncbi:4-hydroxy-tetrahydrodipicolinate reductase [Bacillus carboniphilus]|uniref:4-hydroxy-tetrahydrodipicolinate reductase n=1 Tax=Bacillus carboniphilus TaxID=86663 RepID=A0ABY9JWF9_9BACI|nr:4-hydroxy-tetrahydrodipicolinate reductase [Bacillus carboniphilus]WLR43719.1 4-hydroxy-tetrahydrodipicolinate reductase [Bacillus carboniphilus]